MTAHKQLYRILDANFNRAKEGLRVCEDICRYVWDDKNLTRRLKTLRHGLSSTLSRGEFLIFIEARNIQGDVGKAAIAAETRRKDVTDIFWANAQRVKESLRVLEEVLKVLDASAAQQIKLMRYRMYALEQKAIKRL